MDNLIFVDVEAVGPCPSMGKLTEFGAVSYPKRETFYGRIYDCKPDPENPAKSKIIGGILHEPSEVFRDFDRWLKKVCSGRPIFVSDNNGYDWQWINNGFWLHLGNNPFGHSSRRISDFYAGLVGDFTKSTKWKHLRVTEHDHNPVHDCLGNVEAFERMLKGER